MATQLIAPQSPLARGRRTVLFRRPDFLKRTGSRKARGSDFPPPAPRADSVGGNGNGHDQQLVELFPMVKRLALQMHRHLPAHIEVDDLVGAGVLGLIDAVHKFDASKHVRIENYARHRIRGAILDGLRSLDGASRDMRKKVKKAQEVYRHLEAKLGRPVSDAEMAEGLGVGLEDWYSTVQELQAVGVAWLRPMVSMQLRQPREEALVADERDGPFNLCDRREQRDILNRALARLPERERLIILLYYTQGLTMKQIAMKLGVDESRVSQLHSLALLRMKSCATVILARPQTVALAASGGRG